MRRLVILCLALMPLPLPLAAQDITLSAPPALTDSGVLSYILPRFSLKHRIRVTPVDGPADAALGDAGTPVMTGLGQTWSLSHDGSASAVRFEEWLLSDIGRNTLAAFQIDGVPVFTPPQEVRAAAVTLTYDGDPAQGLALSRQHCGRCHRVDDADRYNNMGASPSFAMLRTLEDWQNRFVTFYVLNPHPSFTQVADITPPFDPARPPPIVPLSMTQDDMDHILAYVATIPPADLGAPIQSQ